MVPRSYGVRAPLVPSPDELAARRAARPGDGRAESPASSTKSTPGTTGRRLKEIAMCRVESARRRSSYALSLRATARRAVNKMSIANCFASSNARMTLQAGSSPPESGHLHGLSLQSELDWSFVPVGPPTQTATSFLPNVDLLTGQDHY